MSGETNKASLLQHTISLFTGRFFNNAATFAVMYLFAHRLSVIDYGRYQSIWIQLNFFTVIAGAGIPLFTLTYSTEKIIRIFRSLHKRSYIYYGLLLISCGMIYALLQYHNIPQWYLITAFLVLFTGSNVADAFTIVARKMNIYAGFSVAYVVAYFLIHYYCLQGSYSFAGLLVYWNILLLVKIILNCIIVAPAISSHSRSGANEPVNKPAMALWKQLYISDIIQVCFLWIDKFILAIFLPSESIAMYSNATVNIPFLPIVISAISSSALLFMSKYPERRIQNLLANNIGRVLSSLVFPLFIYLLIYSQEVIVFLFSEKYRSIVPVFICAIMVLPFRSYNFTLLLQKNEYGRIITSGALIDLCIACILMYPLYLLWGLQGVALSFVISTIFQAVYYSVHTAGALGVSFTSLFPLRNWLIKIVMFTLLGLSLYYVIPQQWLHIPKFLIAGGIMAILALIVFFYEFNRFRHLERKIIMQ